MRPRSLVCSSRRPETTWRRIGGIEGEERGDPAQGLGRRGEEVAAMVPVLIRVVADQPRIGLVNQGIARSVWPGRSWASLYTARLCLAFV